MEATGEDEEAEQRRNGSPELHGDEEEGGLIRWLRCSPARVRRRGRRGDREEASHGGDWLREAPSDGGELYYAAAMAVVWLGFGVERGRWGGEQ